MTSITVPPDWQALGEEDCNGLPECASWIPADSRLHAGRRNGHRVGDEHVQRAAELRVDRPIRNGFHRWDAQLDVRRDCVPLAG